ncbi:PREDICTED: alpha-1,3-mannosyl-glycoprotein 4-beta-N-acetylglucosaminyltransferase C-like [Elephantulus edwardii]|uniref:alpha-1,3-mannosyl-glycoprotein 4-beta-N-acetylglucosaminyltransferase C-like n=1 Tax=Elephantulus edwardii TaxID=28737 RepID=UPI0003F0ACDE|nr:PREDICTED: alpha-1,3-mannosyl-glycoprotein 4-beta-N-acetylglucosaminyltransferase C-like [Elephantulus edwardii]
MQHPNESYLVDTLQYLFQTTSLNEQNYFIVLVHLPNLDPEQLRGTVANISGLFKAHIKAQKLLVIRGLLNDSSLPKDGKNASHSPFREAFYSKQNTDYALLMNFASNLSDYFLMTGDNVHCSSKYVALIYWTVKAWKEIPWVTLEFSDLRFSGKVFHTIHLSQLSTFFLLFQDAPTDLLLSRFRFLLGQRVPISPTTYLFHSQKNRITFEKACYQEEKEKEEDGPENPPAQIFTSMLVKGLHPPEHAYFLNEDYFQTDFAFDGSSYLVIFDESHEVSRIQVLTGTGKNRQYQLENGLVELGYEPVEETGGCTYYTLLGPLVRGNLDQKVFYEDGFVGKVRCVKLLVTNFQNAIVRISHVKIWIKFQEE